MAVRSGFFNSIAGDRTYDAAAFAEYFSAFIGTGVFPDPSTNLQVQTDTGLNVKIKAGKAWINGYILVSDADFSEAIPGEAVLNRIDRIVIQLSYANRDVAIIRKAGTAATTPTAPEVTRDANVYELSLATINIASGASSISSGDITDTRGNESVCGYVSSTITNLPYLTPNRVLISNAEGDLIAGTITNTQLGYLDGVTSNIQTQLGSKQATVTGAASTIVSSNLTANRALISNSSGKVAESAVTSTELGYLNGLSSNVQSQLNSKQSNITGAASTIVSSNLSTNRTLVSDSSGKVAASAVTSTELGYLDGVTSSIQTQLNSKQANVTGAASTIVSSNLTANRALISNGSGKVAVSAVTSTEIGYLDGVSSSIQSQLNGKLSTSAKAADSSKINGRNLTVSASAPSSPSTYDIWVDY